MQISAEYRELNRKLHETRPTYGAGLATNVYYKLINDAYNEFGALSMLDYGCGKGALKKSLTECNINEYDPCIEGKDADPAPCDMLTCLDVMEHIEPELLDNVLDHINTKFNKIAFISVSLVPAAAILADGRNAHLIQESPEWWLLRFKEKFNVLRHMVTMYNDKPHELVVLLGKQ
jgi:2-polyprenyl-3-methyl-5-hydroxy-6-metoxy-1,4-benzoquinol methylase